MWCLPTEMGAKQQRPRIVLVRLSQPVHVFTVLVVCYLSFLLFPRQKTSGIIVQPQPSSLANFIYVTSFATHFGAQFWMTFISGLVLFFNLPRHVFGQVQRLLFPKYFCINAALGFVTLLLFVVHHPQLNLELKLQTWALTVCFLSQLLTRIYVVPPMLSAMEQRSAIEVKAGVGMEVGRHDPGKLRDCPNYMALHRRFRILHMTTAAANVIAFTCNAFHMYHLAKHITT
ncbi:transmembrane protein 205-like [Ornithodoros turicata]|uniref:transmembrane protein 205-like n=1 Tax=Ornithodoros turicata TaxID=34597 RepID=UPI00313A1B95